MASRVGALFGNAFPSALFASTIRSFTVLLVPRYVTTFAGNAYTCLVFGTADPLVHELAAQVVMYGPVMASVPNEGLCRTESASEISWPSRLLLNFPLLR